MSLLNMLGRNPAAMDEMEKARQLGLQRQQQQQQQQQQKQGPSMWERFNQPQNWARLSNAFNTLRFQPDQALAASNQKVIDYAQTQKSANKTAEYLKAAGVPEEQIKAAAGNPELMKALLSAVVTSQYKTPKDSFSTVSGAQLSEMGINGFDPNKMYSVNNTTGKVSSIGGEGPTVNVSTGGADKYAEELGKGRAQEVNTLADSLGKSQEMLNTVSILEALSPAVSESVVPDALKKFIPEGVNSAIDAYKATLNGLAASLRVAGTGAQSDKDVDLLLSRGGSIATSPEARAIAHSALRRKAEMEMQIASLARRHRSNPEAYSYAQFDEERRALRSQSILSDDQRAAIQGLGSQAANRRMGEVDLQNMSAQELDALEKNLTGGGL